MTTTARRLRLVGRLASLVTAGRAAHLRRVAIDGPDAAGKTTLAAELGEHLSVAGVPVTRASIDDFLHPTELRHRRGRLSPKGYYLDSFDIPAIRRRLMDETADRGGVLLIDGVFLLRSELREGWDIAILLEVSAGEILRRAVARDVPRLGSEEEVVERYRRRYLPAQARYRAEEGPEATADVVIDHEDPQRPRVTKWPTARRLGALLSDADR